MRAGRFGAYVNHGKTNATLKANASPETITLEEAIRLIEDKEAAGGGEKESPGAEKERAEGLAPRRPAKKKAPADDDSPPFETAAKRKSAPARKPAGAKKPAAKPAADETEKGQTSVNKAAGTDKSGHQSARTAQQDTPAPRRRGKRSSPSSPASGRPSNRPAKRRRKSASAKSPAPSTSRAMTASP